MEYWSTGVLEHWSIGVMVIGCWQVRRVVPVKLKKSPISAKRHHSITPSLRLCLITDYFHATSHNALLQKAGHLRPRPALVRTTRG